MYSLLKIALPALAAASTAYAQCSISATTTIQNAGDATALASSCSTFSGSIAIATGTTDDIALDGMTTLSGNLVAQNNGNMKQLSAADLTTLDGEFLLAGVTSLYTLNFPKLKTIDTIDWSALPNLQEIGFTATVNQAKSVTIQNTGLRDLKGIDVQEVNTIFIANNGYINSISMSLANVSTALTMADNNEDVNIELPNLVSAANLTFRFCGSVDVPSLAHVNGSLGLYNNGFTSFAAPNLTSVGQALTIVANTQLNNLSFPLLTKISDDFVIANDSSLTEVNGFPLLQSVGGAFNVTGNMTDVETPKLNSVKGAFFVVSTNNITASCDFYQPLQSKKYIQGSYKCEGSNPDPANKNSNSNSSSGKKSGATSLSAVNGALGLAAMAAVLLL